MFRSRSSLVNPSTSAGSLLVSTRFQGGLSAPHSVARGSVAGTNAASDPSKAGGEASPSSTSSVLSAPLNFNRMTKFVFPATVHSRRFDKLVTQDLKHVRQFLDTKSLKAAHRKLQTTVNAFGQVVPDLTYLDVIAANLDDPKGQGSVDALCLLLTAMATEGRIQPEGSVGKDLLRSAVLAVLSFITNVFPMPEIHLDVQVRHQSATSVENDEAVAPVIFSVPNGQPQGGLKARQMQRANESLHKASRLTGVTPLAHDAHKKLLAPLMAATFKLQLVRVGTQQQGPRGLRLVGDILRMSAQSGATVGDATLLQKLAPFIAEYHLATSNKSQEDGELRAEVDERIDGAVSWCIGGLHYTATSPKLAQHLFGAMLSKVERNYPVSREFYLLLVEPLHPEQDVAPWSQCLSPQGGALAAYARRKYELSHEMETVGNPIDWESIVNPIGIEFINHASSPAWKDGFLGAVLTCAVGGHLPLAEQRVEEAKTLLHDQAKEIGPSATTTWCRYLTAFSERAKVDGDYVEGEADDEPAEEGLSAEDKVENLLAPSSWKLNQDTPSPETLPRELRKLTEETKELNALFDLVLVGGCTPRFLLHLQNRGKESGDVSMAEEDDTETLLYAAPSAISGVLKVALAQHRWAVILETLSMLNSQGILTSRFVHPGLYSQIFSEVCVAASPSLSVPTSQNDPNNESALDLVMFLREHRCDLYQSAKDYVV